MKRLIVLFTCTLLLLCSCKSGGSVVGKWIDTKTESIIEFTSDGYYKEGLTQDIWQTPTKYEVRGNKITRYVEGERATTEFEVKYEITDDGKLVIEDVLEYAPLGIKSDIDKE